MPPKANHWSAALTRYAKATDPAALPSNEILHWDEQTITMYDGFDKAKFHFLVLPRIPFKRTASASALAQDKSGKPSLQAVGGRLSLGSSDASNIVPASHLQSITSLLRSPYAGEVLDAMERAGHEVRCGVGRTGRVVLSFSLLTFPLAACLPRQSAESKE